MVELNSGTVERQEVALAVLFAMDDQNIVTFADSDVVAPGDTGDVHAASNDLTSDMISNVQICVI